MVFKPFTTLARQSISKHLVNGYAQSVVAATQSSYASSTLPLHRINQSNAPAKLQNAFGGAHSGRAAPGKDGQSSDCLSSFYALQSQLDENKEDRKYLFSKKILWSKAQHQQQQKQLLGNPPQPIAEPDTATHSRPNSIVSEAASGEIPDDGQSSMPMEMSGEAGAADAAEMVVSSEESVPNNGQSTLSLESVLLSEPHSATAQYNNQMELLRDEGRYQEIAVLFDHMVHEGVKPNAFSYNILLSSIVKLNPCSIPQVLGVYKTMLSEQVTPSTATYCIVIEFLAACALRLPVVANTAEHDASAFGVTLELSNSDVDQTQRKDAMDYALDIFYASTEVQTHRVYPCFVYEVLVQACSKNGRGVDMLNVYSHMESHRIPPTPQIIRSMIRGFGKAGDIRAAIETYNTYQEMETLRDYDTIMMDQRYEIYRALIKAYMESGDSAGALSFLEKVIEINRERARLEWLTQAVIEGFVRQGDLESAKKWVGQLSLEHTNNLWFSKILSLVMDQGEHDFARQIYNSIDFANMNALEKLNHDFVFARCQMSGLLVCVERKDVENSRLLWKDLWDNKSSAGPDPTAALLYTGLLFEKLNTNEAIVILNQYSEYFLDQHMSAPNMILDPETKKAMLQEAYDDTIISLSNKGLLTPNIALDIVVFGLDRCGSLGYQAARRILTLFDPSRLLGLTPGQLTYVLHLQISVLQETIDQCESLLEEDVVNFDVIFNQALDNGILATGSTADAIARGAMILAEARPELLVRWNQYVQLQLHPPVTSVLSAPISPVDQLSPSAEANTIGDDTYDTYWEKTDSDTSNAIDTLLDRSKYNKIADLRRMYRNTRRSGMVLRLTTLAKIVTAASRTAAHQDFIEEIYRNAEVDTPLVHGSHVSKFGWACFMDSLIAAYLNLGNREKANIHHEQMLQMGASPSANTFGLYIVSLRSTHQTHDEASEAVEIFDRARAEDVLPTSFLYNALIGKLSKARRVDDCLFYFAQMRALGIKPTSVTYGTMINALARVGDEGFAEELFQEMESMANYKPRPAPYNSLMQFFITNKRDRSKVLFYYNRMISMKIVPTSHTYKLLIEAYATLDKPDMKAAEGVLATMNANKCTIESSHHAALIHAKGCVLQDVSAAIAHFRDIFNTHRIQPDATLYQALLECLVAHHRVHETPEWVKDMTDRRIAMTPYIANTLIHGWTQAGNIERAREIYDGLVGFGSCGIGQARREPSTYEAMVRGYLAVEDRQNATLVAGEMIARGYPAAVVARVTELVRGATDGATISGGVGVGGNAVAGDGSYLPGGTQEFVTQELS